MTARDELARVLAAHQALPLTESGGILVGFGCPAPCCWGSEGGYDRDAHREHLADAVIREWLPGVIEAEIARRSTAPDPLRSQASIYLHAR